MKVSKNHCFTVYSVATFCLGLQGSLLGPTTTAISRQLGCSEDDLGPIVAMNGICYLIGGFPAGWLAEILPCNVLIAIVLVAQAAALAIIPQSTAISTVTMMFGLMNLTTNCVNSATTVSISWMYPESKTFMYNTLCAVYGVGSLVSPLLAAALDSNDVGAEHLYCIIAAITLLAAVLTITAKSPVPESSGNDEAATPKPHGRVDGLVLVLMSMMVFCTVSTMSCIGTWIYTFALEQEALSMQEATIVNSTYWAFVAIGRVLSSFMSYWLKPDVILLLSLPFCIIGPCCLFLLPTPGPSPLPLLLFAVAAVGLGNSTGSANSFGLGVEFISVTALVNTTVCVVTGLGITVFPAAIPWLSAHTPWGFGVLMVVTIALSVVHMVLVVLTKLAGERVVRKQIREVAAHEGSIAEIDCEGGAGSTEGLQGSEEDRTTRDVLSRLIKKRSRNASENDLSEPLLKVEQDTHNGTPYGTPSHGTP